MRMQSTLLKCFYNILLLLCIIIFYSCRNGSDNLLDGPNTVVTGFPIEEVAIGKKTGLEIMGVNDIFIVDTFFIAFKASGYNDFFEIYSTNNLQPLGTFLSKGKGPDEFLSITYKNEYLHTPQGIKLWISDFTLNKRCCFNLTKSVARGITVLDTVFHLCQEGVVLNLNDSVRLVKSSVPGNILFRLQDKKNLDFLSEYEILKSYIPRYTSDVSLSMDVCKHPSRNLVVGNMLFFNQINFFDFDKKKQFSISYGLPIDIFETAKLSDAKLKMYYSATVPTENYIYALYVNRQMEGFPHFENGVEIHIFDLNGHAVKKISIPENIHYFAVDENNEFIYGLNSQEEIFQYPLSDDGEIFNSKIL